MVECPCFPAGGYLRPEVSTEVSFAARYPRDTGSSSAVTQWPRKRARARDWSGVVACWCGVEWMVRESFIFCQTLRASHSSNSFTAAQQVYLGGSDDSSLSAWSLLFTATWLLGVDLFDSQLLHIHSHLTHKKRILHRSSVQERKEKSWSGAVLVVVCR